MSLIGDVGWLAVLSPQYGARWPGEYKSEVYACLWRVYECGVVACGLVACCLLPVACCLLPVACCLLNESGGLYPDCLAVVLSCSLRCEAMLNMVGLREGFGGC